jgi:hypothetical protein
MKYILLPVLLLGLNTGCSTKAPKDPGKASPPKTPKIVGSSEKGVSFDARQLANEMESNYVSEVRFEKGKAILSTTAKKSLAKVIAQARKENSLKKAILVTWADKEMPTEKKGELSEDQIELARKRNDALTGFIQNFDRKINIDRVSMAERPGGLKKIVPNETARIQESLEEAGIPEGGEKKNGLGKASRSIIIFTRE